MSKIIFSFIFSFIFLGPSFSLAEEDIAQKEIEKIYKAVVIEKGEKREELIPGTDTKHTYQKIKVKILNQDKEGETIDIDNDYFLMDIGDVFYLKYLKTFDSKEIYSVSDLDRTKVLMSLILFFALVVLLLGGKKGFMSLLSLFLSFVIIFYVLFPGILKGYNPLLLSGIISFVLLLVLIFLTHGLNRKSISAFMGCFVTIVTAIFLSYFVVMKIKLTGFTDDESVYLNFNTKGGIDFQGLLLGAIIIGTIGIIDDIAITQASIVSELKNLEQKLSNFDILTKALSIGRDHMGSVVNSLILAYAGASMPLLMLIYTSKIPLLELLSRESISTEIVRALIGSTALMMAMPVTTLFAIYLIKKNDKIEKGHNHSHKH
jgi:uncharacterized membrane protein